LNFAFFNLLFKLPILFHLLAKVSESLALGVEEEIVKLGEVELDLGLGRAALLFVVLLRCLGCCLCHYVRVFG